MLQLSPLRNRSFARCLNLLANALSNEQPPAKTPRAAGKGTLVLGTVVWGMLSLLLLTSSAGRLAAQETQETQENQRAPVPEQDIEVDSRESDLEPIGESPFSKAIQYAQSRTVKIYGATVGRVEGYGTGILVSSDGLILTTSGVYLSGRRVRVVLDDGSSHTATLLRSERSLKLSLLKIDHEVDAHFQLQDEPNGQKGDWAVSFSNAFKVADGNEPMSVNLGIISLRTQLESLRGDKDVLYRGPVILIDAITSNPGAAGGAVVGLDGKLIGMIGKVIESQDTNTRLNYAVPAETLKAFLEGKLIEAVAAQTTSDQDAKPATLGIRLFGLNGPRSPAYIDRLSRGGPGAAAKLRPDDLIISVAGRKISTIRDFQSAEKTLRPGEPVVVVVERNNELVRVELTPIEK